MLRIHNSLTGQKADFRPRVAGQVGLYVCGVTVYDYCHLGHARFLLVFDSVVRHLEASGLAVNYVRNITDVDDKINARAYESGEDIGAITRHTTEVFHSDMAALGDIARDTERLIEIREKHGITLVGPTLGAKLGLV